MEDDLGMEPRDWLIEDDYLIRRVSSNRLSPGSYGMALFIRSFDWLDDTDWILLVLLNLLCGTLDNPDIILYLIIL